MKKIAVLILIFMSFAVSGYRKPEIYVIDAAKNAAFHNNRGIDYLSEKCYYAAIQEFKIAISLNSNSQASAVYYNNLGKTYMLIGYPQLAQDCFERAIKHYSLNLEYYQNLAKCYNSLGILNAQIIAAEKSKTSLSNVKLGIMYAEQGNYQRAVIVLDEFAAKEPDLLITPAIRKYINELVKETL